MSVLEQLQHEVCDATRCCVAHATPWLTLADSEPQQIRRPTLEGARVRRLVEALEGARAPGGRDGKVVMTTEPEEFKQTEPTEFETETMPFESETVIEPEKFETKIEPEKFETRTVPSESETVIEPEKFETRIKPIEFETKTMPFVSETAIEPEKFKTRPKPDESETVIEPEVFETKPEDLSAVEVLSGDTTMFLDIGEGIYYDGIYYQPGNLEDALALALALAPDVDAAGSGAASGGA
jgi:hypothetical protein